MTKKTNKDAPVLARWPVIALSVIGSLAVEAMIAGSIIATNHEIINAYGIALRIAYAEASLSVVMGLMSTYAGAAAQIAANDPRPEERAKAGRLRIISLVCLIGPVIMLGAAYTHPKLVADHKDYISGPLAAQDQKTIADDMADARLVVIATERFEQKGYEPSTAKLDLKHHFDALLWAALVYGLVTQVPGLVLLSAPETPAEARRRVEKEVAIFEATKRAESIAKGLETRERNRKARDKELRKAQRLNAKNGGGSGGLGSLLPFAKKGAKV